MNEATHAARQQDLPTRSGITFQRPAIVGLFYLANIFTGFSVLVGLVLAYVWRREADAPEWERSHYTYLIRTFWIGLAVFAATFVLMIVAMFSMAFDAVGPGEEPEPGFVAGVLALVALWLLVTVWFCIRSILSLVKASNCEPMPKPGTWLF